MRAETRHQLKEDRFSRATLNVAEKTVHWTVEHQSKLVAAVIALIVVAGIALGGWYYISSQNEKASAELSVATRTMETPIRPAGVPPQPGFDSFGSLKERATAARKQFQAIVDKYPHTYTGDMAKYFVGLTALQMEDYPAAERNLQDTAHSSNKELGALSKLALASAYRSENKDTQALDIYKQLMDKPTATVSKVTAQFEMADFYESRQKPDEAKRIYQQVEKENPATEAASLAQQRAGQIK